MVTKRYMSKLMINNKILCVSKNPFRNKIVERKTIMVARYKNVDSYKAVNHNANFYRVEAIV